MFTSLMLAASMLMISDRDNIWDYATIAPETQYAMVDEAGITMVLDSEEVDQVYADMKGKRVLVLIHGFDTTKPYGYYFDIEANVNNAKSAPIYDQFIGYVWPCHDESYEYYAAKKSVSDVKFRFRKLLEKMKSLGVKIDVFAHSLGNFLVLETLDFEKKPSSSNYIQNFFSVAPAVSDSSINQKEVFYRPSQNCDQMFVFYSKRDSTLKWVYSVAEWNKALGYGGDQGKFSSNVQMVDCSSVISTHSAYLFSWPVFNYVRQVSLNPKLAPRFIQDIELQKNGVVQVIHYRHPIKNLLAKP